MTLIKDIIASLEALAPLAYQESYDNSGLIIGNANNSVEAALITLDITENVVDEAIENNCDLIISHHPILFGGLKKINGSSDEERCVIKAIQNNIAIYACHTNIDSVKEGVSWKMGEKLSLQNMKILVPSETDLLKLVTFIPKDHIQSVTEALFQIGIGKIGDYDSCSFQTKGEGTFRGLEQSNAFVGEKFKLHTEEEIRFEAILPAHLQHIAVATLKANHPYEEVAYDLVKLENKNEHVGFGVVGTLKEELNTMEFLQQLKKTFHCDAIKHTDIVQDKIKKIALCGGSGSSFLKQAKREKADIYISGDFKYHQFFETENRIIIADIGHYESEQFTKDVFYERLTKKFPKFAIRLSQVRTNPVHHLF